MKWFIALCGGITLTVIWIHGTPEPGAYIAVTLLFVGLGVIEEFGCRRCR